MGLPERAAAATLAVWPNPAHGQLHVAGATGTVQLLDALGRVVCRGQLPVTGAGTLDVRHLTPGVYTLRAGGGARRVVME